MQAVLFLRTNRVDFIKGQFFSERECDNFPSPTGPNKFGKLNFFLNFWQFSINITFRFLLIVLINGLWAFNLNKFIFTSLEKMSEIQKKSIGSQILFGLVSEGNYYIIFLRKTDLYCLTPLVLIEVSILVDISSTLQ